MGCGSRAGLELEALAAEARARGTTYGKMVSRMSASEVCEIVQRYAETHKRRKVGR